MIELVLLALALGVAGITQAKRHWRNLVFAVMIFMVYEGAVRKWLLPGLQAFIYFVKDGMLILAFAGFMMEHPSGGAHERPMQFLKLWMGCFAAYCFLEIANPNSPNVLLGFLGFKSTILYSSLLFMVPYIFKSIDDLRDKINKYIIFMIPVIFLGSIQYLMPPDHWINTYVQQDASIEINVALFGTEGRARTTGTFAYIGGYQAFVPVMFALSLAYAITQSGSIFKNLVPSVLFGGCAAGMFTTGSRSVVFGCLLIAVMAISLSLRGGLIRGGTVIRLVFGGIFFGGLVMYTSESAVDSFWSRVDNADDPVERALTPYYELLRAFDTSPFIGFGIGTNTNGAAQIMGANKLNGYNFWWLQGNGFEVETARIMQELGVVGFSLSYGMRIMLIFVAARMINKLRTRLFKGLSASIASIFTLDLGLFVVNNPTGGLYFWFAAGLLFAMYRLDREYNFGVRPHFENFSPKSLGAFQNELRSGSVAELDAK